MLTWLLCCEVCIELRELNPGLKWNRFQQSEMEVGKVNGGGQGDGEEQRWKSATSI
jgi:hypothetical protein